MNAASSPRKERIEQQMKILEEKHGESTMAPYCYKLWAEMLVSVIRYRNKCSCKIITLHFRVFPCVYQLAVNILHYLLYNY